MAAKPIVLSRIVLPMSSGLPVRRLIAVLSGLLASGVLAFSPNLVSAEESPAAATPEAVEHFEKHIRPLFIRECQRCHGAEKQQGELRLDSAAGWRTGGDSGPAVVPGDPEGSLLYEAIQYDAGFEMPPRGKLSDAEIAHVRKWIKQGAYDPRTESETAVADNGSITDQGRQFWSFQPVAKPAIPEVVDAVWPRGDIDRFIKARQETVGLNPGPDADRVTLLRRLHYDLTGLPPTPEQIDAFLADQSANAIETLVDDLLDSPHFGEQWGRHWLDVVRFAESSGGGRTLLFPDAWRYRDYVIDAFNTDRPYDQFINEQIAGDLLTSDDWRERRRQMIATGFLLLGPTNYELQDKDVLELDVVDEQLDTMGKALMGMSLGCARCHDHKFDPIPTHDYYALAGIFKSTKAMIHSNVSQWNTVELPLPPEEEAVLREQETQLASMQKKVADVTKRWEIASGKSPKKGGPRSIDPAVLDGVVVDNDAAVFVGEWMQSTSVTGYVGSDYQHDETAGKGEKSAEYRVVLSEPGDYDVRLHWTPGTNRSTKVPITIQHAAGAETVVVNQREPAGDGTRGHLLGRFAFSTADEAVVTISNTGTLDGVVIADAVQFVRYDATKVDEIATVELTKLAEQKELKAEVDRLSKEVKAFEKSMTKRPIGMVVGDDADAGDIPLAIRGVAHEKGPIVPRGVLQVVKAGPFGDIAAGESGRRELADWLVRPEHPLLARVYVNRVWHWLMGRGLVATVDNFGTMGQAPTHPELLDHLASKFVEEGWSTKQLVRQIVLSRTYQLSSEALSHEQTQLDPDNRLLARANRKRISAEGIRDTLLTVGGNLDPSIGGPGMKPGTGSEYGYQFTGVRRSVYVPVFRNTLHEMFEVFDFADPNIQQGSRSRSTVSSQALLMMNHPFVTQQSHLAAQQLLSEGGTPWTEGKGVAVRGRTVEPPATPIAGALSVPPKSGPASESGNMVDRINYAWKQVLGRPPTTEEQSIAAAFLENSTNQTEVERWTMLYHGLFQSIDFRLIH